LRLSLAAYDTGAGASGMKTNKQTSDRFGDYIIGQTNKQRLQNFFRDRQTIHQTNVRSSLLELKKVDED